MKKNIGNSGRSECELEVDHTKVGLSGQMIGEVNLEDRVITF